MLNLGRVLRSCLKLLNLKIDQSWQHTDVVYAPLVTLPSTQQKRN